MKNIAFVIWLIGYPLFETVTETIRKLYLGREITDDATLAIMGWISFIFYITISVLLFEKRHD